MQGLLTAMLDWCFPPRADELRVRACTTIDPLIQPRTIADVVTLLPYPEPTVQALIHEAKFYNNRRAQQLLATALEHYLATVPTPYVIIPMPLSRQRYRERGYNQIHAIVERSPTLAPRLGRKLLVRRTHTQPQTSLDRAARLKNMDGVFTCKGVVAEPNHTYILLDDVYTTGATMAAARAALAPHLSQSSRLICLALAH